MDQPDGGSVDVLEQFRRMADDARITREERERVARANAEILRTEG